MAAVLVDHIPVHSRPHAAGAAVPDNRGLQAVRPRLPVDERRSGHSDRDDRASRLPHRLREQQDERIDRARLHPALHRHRAHQPLSLLRQPARQGGSGFMTDMTVNAPAGSAPSARMPLTRRLRFGRSASGVGDAGWGRTIGATIVSLIYFFPVFWIILTAFKTYEDALAVPAKFFFTPTLENFAQVFSRAYSAGGPTVNTGFTLYFFNSLFIS